MYASKKSAGDWCRADLVWHGLARLDPG